MSKIAIVYWSGTGNTEAMANAVADEAEAGCRSLGAALAGIKKKGYLLNFTIDKPKHL